jgi:predicted CXXCH cytochrome family protein
MSTKKQQPSARKFRLMWVIIPLAVLVVLGIAGFIVAATVEENDSFCASCHTQPESTYYDRSQSAAVSDLAGFHHGQEVKCIDCHSGEGFGGRFDAILMGAHNAFTFYTGTAIQPAKLIVPIQDGNCLKCHANVTKTRTQDTHFHYFLSRWQSVDPNGAGHCVTCHTSHTTDGQEDLRYLNATRTEAVCQRCHNTLGSD